MELAHESDLSSPIFRNCTSMAPGGPHSVSTVRILFHYDVGPDLRPGKYFVRASVRDEPYCEHQTWLHQVLYDVTGNGPNSGWEEGMWLEAFEISECINDTESPVVGLECGTPTHGGDVTFSWTGKDNCSSNISYQYMLKNQDTAWSSWASSGTRKSYYGLANGSYTFCVKAKDENDNISSEECCQITVSNDSCANDSTPPSVTLNCGTPDSSGNVSFSWSGSDNCSSNISYQYKLEGKDTSWSSWSHSTSKSYYGLGNGTYQFCVKAKDEAGNISSSECCSVTVSQDSCANDSTPPSVTLNCGTPDSSGNVSFSWSGSDNCSSNISYQYKLEGKDTSWSSWSHSTSKSYYGLGNGTYQFCVKAKDEAGNISSSECCSVTVSQDSCANDSTPPSVTLNCGTPDSSGNVSFSWSGSDNCSSNISYQYKLEGKDTTWSSWSHSTSKSYYGLGNGIYQFCVKAKDEAGNVSASKCCSFTVGSTPSGDLALVSKGATATASSWGSYGGYDAVPNAAIDGSHELGWGGTQGAGDWLKIDLGKVYRIRELRVDNGYHSLEYTYSFSTDGTSWVASTLVVSSVGDHYITDPLSNIRIFSFPDGMPMRYIRIDILDTNAPASHIWQAVINEVEAYAESLY